MNYKTTLKHLIAILRNRIPISMAVLFSFLLLIGSSANAQTLKTDSNVPLLDVCAEYQQFTVRIAKGGRACASGRLQIQIPLGFELQTGSVKVNGATASVTGESGQGVSVTLPNIPAGPSTEEMVITYYVKALCSAIGSALPAAEQVVNYTFSGCGNTPQMGTSEIINIEYAVLRVNVNPPTSSGKIGDEIVRTVTIRNQGNGEIPSLVLEKILGNGLSHVSYDFSSALGWTVDASNLNKIIFSGPSLDTGGSITFKEKVRITGCDLSPSIFEAYYGCTTKCTNSNVNGIAQHIVNIDSQFQPKLEITAAPLSINCLNQKYQNTWDVKNTGNGEASEISFEIGTSDAAGFIDLNSIIVGGVAVNPADITIIEGTAGAPKKIKVKLTADNTLDPNQVIVVKFDQFYGAPTAPTCDAAPTTFTTNNNYYNLSYDFAGGCGGPYSDTKTVSPAVTYAYEGLNIGEIDVVTGQPYKADYLFTNFKVPFANLNVGDKFDVTIELSPMLSIANINDIKIITGASAVNFVVSPDGANKYRLTFTYGTAPWNVGQDLDLSNSRLEFPMDFVCDAGADPSVVQDIWYKVGGELIKNPGCTPISFKCNTVSLMGYCDAGPCPNGLHNRSADLERVTLGFGVDALGQPTVTRVDKANANIRTFITGDVLEISQKSDVVITSVASWTKVKFQVEKDVDTQVNLIANSGKLIVNRLGADTEFSGLTVTENATNYILEFDLTTQPNALVAFAQGDKVRFSMQFKALDSQLGLKKFPTKSVLIDADGNEFICGRSYTATGFYVTKAVDFKGAKTSFSTCENSDNKVVITSSILGYAVQDGVFTKEFRDLFEPTKATLTIPEHLTLKGLKVEIKNQPWLGIQNTALVSGLNVNNGNYVLDLTTIFNGLTGGRYLDEGFVLEITPTVALFECEPTATEKIQNITVALEANVVDGAGDKTPFTATQQLEYSTGYGSLTMELSNNNLNGEMSADGREVTWVVKVENTSNSRTFANVWLGKKTGNLVLKSVQKVDNYDGNNPLAGISPNVDVYELGDFAALSKSYYLVTADLINCNVESLTIPVGYSCTGYPADVNSGVCVINDKVLTYSALKNNLQTTIVFQSNANTQHGFCDILSYTVQIHNGGDSEVSKIVVKVPLGDAPGLKYNGAFKYSTPFMGAITPAVVFANGNPASAVIVGTDLVITLDNSIVLNTLERVQVKIDFKIESCEFRSGQRIAFEPTGENVCGSPIPQGSITNASGNRIIVAGGSTAFPEMVLNRNEIVLDPVLTVGGSLRAVYNFSTTNSGNFGNKDALTTDYRVAFKFPTDWVMVGSPIDYLVPAGSASFEGIDPVRGYIYKITKNLPVGTEVKLVNVPLKYVGTDTTNLTCEHNFGEIEVSIYQNIAVPTCVNPNLSCPNGIDQVLLENQVPMVLPIDGMLMIVPPQQTREICNPLVGGGQPTLEDIMFNNGYFLSWYENELDANAEVSELPSSTPLIDGRTYYVVNRFIAGGLCRSNIAAIKVVLKANNLATANVEFVCSVDQRSYVIYATLNGTAPYVVNGTGAPGTFNGNQWISGSIPVGTPYNVTFESAEACTPLVFTGIPPVCCSLEIACPANVTVTCGTSYEPSVTGNPKIVTACGITTYTYVDSPISNCTAGLRTFTRTFTVTDSTGSTATCTQTISIIDNVAPVLNVPAQYLTVSCETKVGEALIKWLDNHGGAEATDACGPVTWTHNYDSLIVGACPSNKSATVTFTATDACGNKVSTTATFRIEDKTAPEVTITAQDQTVECDGAGNTAALTAWLANHGGAVASDACGIVTWSHNFTALTAGTCAGSQKAIVVFTATDACGNAAVTTATFNIVDTTAPTITVAPQNTEVECDGAGNTVAFQAWLDNHGGATATDDCGTVTWTYLIEDTNTTCGKAGTVIVDFIATDACGNTAFKQAAFIIKDTTPPVIQTPAADLAIECGAEVDALNAWLNNHGGAISSDTCGTITWTNNYTSLTAACGNTGSALVTFTATDSCGNTNTTTATISVVDTVVPTLVTPAQDQTVECDGAGNAAALTAWLANHGGAEATDACGAVTWSNNFTALAVGACAGSQSALVTFTATDACGNTIATTATFTIEDKTAPVISVVAQSLTVECDGAGNAAAFTAWLNNHGGAVANDACSAGVTWTYTNATLVAGACGGSKTATVIFTATDACGNAASTTATFNIADTKAPTITLAPKNMEVECDGAGNTVAFQAWLANHGGATATDDCGAVTWTYLIEDTNTTCGKAGTVIVDFIATDACGNTAFKQAAFIIKDTTPPVIQTPAKDLTIECGAELDALNAWLNNHGGAVSTDTCGTITWTHDYEALTAACGNTGSALVTFTATDSCGNSNITTATIQLIDTTAPVLERVAQNLTVACGSNVTETLNNWLITHGGAVVTDACGAVTWTHDFVALTTRTCGVTGSAVVTFIATDACGNKVETKATYTVEDKTAPIITREAQDIVVNCDGTNYRTAMNLWLLSHGGATIGATCSDVTWANNFTVLSAGETGSAEITFIATDACGNSVSTTATYTVVDNTAPVITVLPQNKVVECDGAGNLAEFQAWLDSHAGAEATDLCGVPTWSYLIEDTNTTCGKAGTVIVDFIVTDEFGNSTFKQAAFIIKDTTAPVITTAAKNLNIECGAELDALNAWLNNHGGAISSDTCGTITWTHNYESLTAACGTTGFAEVTFTATDSCGNTSTTVATVRLTDTAAPTLVKAAQNLTVTCDENTEDALVNWLTNQGNAQATDTCGAVTWNNDFEGLTTTACGATGSALVTFTATDACGNEVTTTATYTVVDRTAAVITRAAQNKTVECDGSGNTAELNAWLAINGGATATDACSDLTWTNDYVSLTTACGATGSALVTFTATDACGNKVTTTATFTIVDTTAPVMTTLPQNEVVECDGAGNVAAFNTWLNSHATAVATDVCSTTVTWSHTIVDTSNLCGKTKVTTVNFTATDACGNAVTKQATFTIEDTTGPIITVIATDLTLECGTNGNDAITTWLNNHGGATATEACGTVTWSHNYNGLTAACGATGSAIVTFTAADSCGNTTTTIATVRIVDTVAPTLVKAAQNLTVECGSNTTEALNNWLSSHGSARATDTCGSVTWTNNYTSLTAACGATGSAIVIFTATDACGNSVTTTATFTIVDTTAPVLTRAAQNKTVECDGSGNTTELDAWLASNGGAAATDTCSTVTWTNDFTALVASCGATGTAEVTFTATDACGNTVSSTANFTIVDTKAPIMTTTPQNATVECDGAGNVAEFNAWLDTHANAVATDACSAVTWTYVIIETNNLCGKTKAITVNFIATDDCGNSVSKQAVFTTQNTVGPQFVTEAQDLTVECDGNGNANDLMAWLNTFGGATAVNDCSTGLTWTNNFKGLTKACGSTGSAEVIFTVTDSCGNVKTTTASFTIVDNIAPVFTANLPKDITLECSDTLPEAAVLTVSDNCGTAEVSFNEVRVNGDCENNYTLLRTWIATDTCGNTKTHVQTITIQDTTAPVFVEPLPTAEIFVKCADLKEAAVITAVDACGKVNVVLTEEKVQGDCDNKYSLIRTWIATDTCGNETTFTQTVNVACEIDIYNAISANGDGENDEFVLKGLNCYPGNTVEIFNRWGRLVYSTTNYNSRGNVFKGLANAKDVIGKDEKLPTGTYFYVIQYDYDLGNGQSEPMKQSGYIHLESN